MLRALLPAAERVADARRAQLREWAVLALGALGEADIAAEQQQPVAAVDPLVLRQALAEVLLDLLGGLRRRQAQALRDARDVRVDDDATEGLLTPEEYAGLTSA